MQRRPVLPTLHKPAAYRWQREQRIRQQRLLQPRSNMQWLWLIALYVVVFGYVGSIMVR